MRFGLGKGGKPYDCIDFNLIYSLAQSNPDYINRLKLKINFFQDLAMRKCTKKERLKKIDENVAKAKERQKEMHKNYRDGMERMKRGEDI